MKAELRLLAHIQLAGQDPKNWTACAWLLERRHPQDYSRRSLPAGGSAYLPPDATELARALVTAQAEVRASVPRPAPSAKPSGSS